MIICWSRKKGGRDKISYRAYKPLTSMNESSHSTGDDKEVTSNPIHSSTNNTTKNNSNNQNDESDLDIDDILDDEVHFEVERADKSYHYHDSWISRVFKQ